MKKLSTILSLLLLSGLTAGLLADPLFAQLTAPKKADLELVADRTAYSAGETLWIAGVVNIDDHWHANSHTPSYEYLIPTTLNLELPEGFGEPTISYPPHKMLAFAFTDGPIAVYEGEISILAEIALPEDLSTDSIDIKGSLRYQACDDRQCLAPTSTEASLSVAVGEGESINEEIFAKAPYGGTDEGHDSDQAKVAAEAGGETPPSTDAAPISGASLWTMLFLAMIGGLILNAMPCVLPVLSIKIFGLVQSAGQGRKHLVIGCLATAAGVLVSFWALAAAAVAALGAGSAIGWGVQFQQPGFVAFLTVVVILFSLNMWGLFEITLPGSVAQLAGGGNQREGVAGHFMTGLFATLMATPCSAPFLGTAVGFALIQPPTVIFAIFTAIGVGLALPYLILAVAPGAARFFPKPGNWMMTFKGIMGFLLAAAAVWLFYVLAAQVTSETLAFVQFALLLMALFTWLFHQSALAEEGWKRPTALAGTAIMGIAAIALAVTGPAPVAAGGQGETNYHQWLAFDEQEVESLTSEGRIVFVDVTADWCITCKTIEKLVLETPEIAEAFEKHDVVTMKADWTNRDDRITAFLARFGKAAVPFFVLFAPDAEPHPFGEVLTQESLLEALDRVSG